jgi:hypothetical protein
MSKPQRAEPASGPRGAVSTKAQDILEALAAYDNVELPPELEEWLSRLVGRFHTSFDFDPETYFDEQVLYD